MQEDSIGSLWQYMTCSTLLQPDPGPQDQEADQYGCIRKRQSTLWQCTCRVWHMVSIVQQSHMDKAAGLPEVQRINI